MFVCKICKKEFEVIRALSAHITKSHKIKSKTYYEKYMKKNDEGKCYCSNDCKFISLSKGYHLFCSTKCANKIVSKETKEKQSASAIKRFEKMTSKEKDEYQTKLRSNIKKDKNGKVIISDKTRTILSETCRKNFTGWVKSKEQIEKHKNKMIGRKFPNKNYTDEQRKIMSERMKNRVVSPKTKKKISEGLTKSWEKGLYNKEDLKIKRQKTIFEKHGVIHISQVPEIHKKQQKHRFKKYSMPSGKIVNIQGYENYALDYLLKTYKEEQLCVDRKTTPKIKYKNETGEHLYYPDIFIPKENLIIEVKSDWTYKMELEKNLLKKQATIETGYNFQFLIFDENGGLVRL